MYKHIALLAVGAVVGAGLTHTASLFAMAPAERPPTKQVPCDVVYDLRSDVAHMGMQLLALDDIKKALRPPLIDDREAVLLRIDGRLREIERSISEIRVRAAFR